MNTESTNPTASLWTDTANRVRRYLSTRRARRVAPWGQVTVYEPIDAATKAYMESQRQRWPVRPRTASSPVVLVSQYHYRPVLHEYSYFANFLADRCNGVIASYNLDRKISTQFSAIYESFGAPLELSLGDVEDREEEAIELGTKAFEGLQTKQQLARFEIEGLRVGDFLYNWYCRTFFKATVDLHDPAVRTLLIHSYLIYFAAQKYLAEHEVAAVLPNHSFYPNCGILTRLAMAKGVPAYTIYARYTPTLYPGYLNAEGWPENSKRIGPYYRYRQLFAELPADAQIRGQAVGRAALEKRLGGVRDDKVLVHTTAWGQSSGERILAATDKPKILVMAHDFCDNVHKFRQMIFPDFYEWLRFIFAHARDTPYEWYLKPHPNLILEAKNVLNRAVLGEMQKEFPWITFLPSGLSNGQLLSEGVTGAFTTHGTASHEFAYLGIPVVNCGDNLHAGFEFNYHARTEDELRHYIAEAGRLPLVIPREQIEQFCFMHLCDTLTIFEGRPTAPETQFLLGKELHNHAHSSEVFSFIRQHETEATHRAIRSHFDDYFARGLEYSGRYLAAAQS